METPLNGHTLCASSTHRSLSAPTPHDPMDRCACFHRRMTGFSVPTASFKPIANRESPIAFFKANTCAAKHPVCCNDAAGLRTSQAEFLSWEQI